MRFFWCAISVSIGLTTASAQTPAQLEFFEKKIRPLLHAYCVECHGAEGKKVKGGLRLTSRAEVLAGGQVHALFDAFKDHVFGNAFIAVHGINDSQNFWAVHQ